MKLRKLTTERENGLDIDIYAACQDDGTVICHNEVSDFSPIINSTGFDNAMSQFFNPDTKIELFVKEGRCQNKYILYVRILHALNNAPDEFLLQMGS